MFFALGIVNPFGPTLSFVAAVGDWEDGNVLPIVNVMLNPFAQSVEEVARLTVGSQWQPLQDLEPLIQLGFGSCPTLVLTSTRIPEQSRLFITTKILETFGDAVVGEHARVSAYFGDPVTRVSAELKDVSENLRSEQKQGAWKRFSRILKGASQQTTSPLSVVKATERLAQLILQPQHIWPELRALSFAWDGSIHKTGILKQLAASAFPKERFERFLLERVLPSVWLPGAESGRSRSK